jgi:branched-chain amino acid transport system substrate-binding protein
LLTTVACWLLPACSVIVDSNSDQCESSTDCSAYPGTSCQDGVCLAGGAPCETNQQCIDDAGGQPAICRQSDRRCATLLTADCASVVPSPEVLSDDGTILFAYMGPLVAPADEGEDDFSSLGIPIKQGVELAFSEILTEKNGLPSPTAGAPPRPLALLACHDLADPIGTAEHLTGTVQVPAIFGPAFSGVTADVAQQVAIPAGVMVMSASATSPSLTAIEDDGLLWRTVPSDSIQAVPLANLVEYVEARIRARQELNPTDQIRLAITVKGDAYGKGLANAVTKLLQFNGKDATANGVNFLQLDFADPSTGASVDFPGIVADIVDFAPDIVIPLGTNESVKSIVGGIEAAWPTTGGAPPLPSYVCPDGGRLDEMKELVDADNSLRGRVVGSVPGHKTADYNAFALRFRAAFNNEDPGTYAENAYDAGYLLSYAAVSLGSQAINGRNLAEAMAKMVGGTAIEPGPDGISPAFQALRGGSAIDYNGASGRLDFNLETGEAVADIDTWCVDLNGNGNAVFVFAGQYYDATSQEFVGSVDQCCNLGNEGCTSNAQCCSGVCDTETTDACVGDD